MQPYPVTGYPAGADADTIGALILASNGVLQKSGSIRKRSGYAHRSYFYPTAIPYTLFVLGNITYVVSNDGGTLKVHRLSDGTVNASISSDLVCRSTSTYRKVFDDMLDTFKTQEGTAQQISCFPAMTFDGSVAVQSGAPRAREITILSEADANAVIGAGTGIALGLAAGERCAYRTVFSYIRTNGAEVSGAPSGRTVYSRGSTATPTRACPRLQLRLPNLAPAYKTAGYTCYLSLYRSPILTAKDTAALGAGSTDPAPSDEMSLVYKRSITSGEMTAGLITVTDVTPPGMESVPLYTNASTNAERWMPPKTNSVAVYKNTAFYGGSVDRFMRVTLNLVSTPYLYPSGSGIVATASEIKIPTIDTDVPVLANGDIVSLKCSAPVLAADYVVNGSVTVAAGYIVIPVASPPAAGSYTGVATFGKLSVAVTDAVGSATYAVRASFNAAVAGESGKFLVPTRLVAGSSVVSTRDLLQECAANICQGINVTLWASNRNVVASNLATKTLEVGTITIEADQATAFSVTASDAVADYRSLSARLAGSPVATADAGLNSLWWSTPGIYDHVCPGNRWFFGSPDKEILRVVATRDVLYVFKEDGTWIVSGDGAGAWTYTELSLELRLLMPCLATVYKDQVFAATNMGIVELSGGSIRVISDAIQDMYHRMMAGRINQNTAASLTAFSNHPDICCNSCVASWFDGTITFSMPVLTTAFGGSKPMQLEYMIFTYCFDTEQWLVTTESPTYIPSTEAGTSGVEQRVVPLIARPAILLESGSPAYDTTMRQVVRLNMWEFIATSAIAMELGGYGANNEGPRVYSDEYGLLTPQNCDVVVGTASAVTPGVFTQWKLTASAAALTPLPAAGVSISATGPDQWYWMTDNGTMYRVLSFIQRAGEMRFTIASNAAAAGSGMLLLPITARWRFAPLGNGANAYNFNQVALLLSRFAKATRIQFTFWLDDGTPYPYVSPTKVPLSGSDVSPNVVRAEVPPSMTRGSRLTIELYHNMPNERLELNKLLLDLTPIAGEEILY